MKYLFSLIAIAIAFNVCVKAGKYSNIIKSMATSCKAQENASDQDVEELSNGKAPTTKEGKCLSACMGKQFGIIIDSKLSKEGFLSKAYFILTSDSDKKKADEVAEECKTVTHDDRCEAADLIWKCMVEGAKKRGVEIL
ncbi:hypothetical protein PVAND_010800 [Polypedilum vanderplanki]|uniref:Odorant binding protein n=1 Tax=Polypedilum vanderplanki TaxID=319348 RepID=A0A9J6CH34_POLVA|nr:hypothetical protein PVAND_010800 [Polypedilum vanderplanki]